MLTIAQIKLHCRIDADDDDALLETYRLAAWQYTQNILGRKLYEQGQTIPPAEADAIHADAVIMQAQLLMCGHWYKEREASFEHRDKADLPSAVYHLLAPYRILGI